jgi:20S proteasome subunit alpha 5
VEYAIKAVQLGSTAIGIKTNEGIVLAVEKRVTSVLMEASSVEKVMEIDTHIGTAMSGLIADARTLVDHARIEAQNHRYLIHDHLLQLLVSSACSLHLFYLLSLTKHPLASPSLIKQIHL